MLLSSLILATSSSIDSLGIGITYGLKDTKISNLAKIILFIISITITSISVLAGDFLTKFLPEFLTMLIGALLLIAMGFWVIFQVLRKNKKEEKQEEIIEETKVYQLFIRFLGITIQIIRNPISSDLDHSNKIEAKEAIYLGIALSIDSLCIGLGSSIMGINSFLFPFLVAIFQIMFLSIGRFLGNKLQKISIIPDSIWNIISGILLIGIGISRLFL